MPSSTGLRFDTGRICLDLLATVGGNLSTDPVERLDCVDRLALWLGRTGIVPEAEPMELDSTALAEFLALRKLLHRIIHRELTGEPADDDDIEQLNHLTRPGPPPSRLVKSSSGGLRRRLVARPRLEQLLAVVSEDAVRLLSSHERKLLRQCEGPTCDLVYLDTSRGHRRRWCSARACGNRHYVAAHRARKVEPR